MWGHRQRSSEWTVLHSAQCQSFNESKCDCAVRVQRVFRATKHIQQLLRKAPPTIESVLRTRCTTPSCSAIINLCLCARAQQSSDHPSHRSLSDDRSNFQKESTTARFPPMVIKVIGSRSRESQDVRWHFTGPSESDLKLHTILLHASPLFETVVRALARANATQKIGN
jgi:hypothetical protein